MTKAGFQRTVRFSFLLQAVLFFLISPIRPDPHHDGIFFTPAVALSEGRVLYRDVFSLYGPLLHWIDGLIFLFAPKTVLTLRLVNTAICVAISVSLYLVMNKLGKQKLGLAFSTVWVFSSAVFCTSFKTNFIQSASLMSTLLFLGIILVAFEFIKKHNNIWGLVLGVLFSIAGMTRIQNFATLPILMLLVYFNGDRSQLGKWKFVHLGFALSNLCFVFYLIVTESMIPYFQQTLLFPAFFYPEPADKTPYNIFLYLMFGILTLLLSVILSMKRLKNISIKSMAMASFSVFLAMTILGRWLLNQNQIKLIPKLVLGEPLDRSTQSLGYFFVSATLWFTFRRLFLSNRQPMSLIDCLILALSLVSITQLFPKPDVMHLWWICPVIFISANLIRNQEMLSRLQAIAFGISGVGVLLLVNFLSGNLIPEKNPIFSGMKSFKSESRYFSIYDVLAVYESKSDFQADFNCQQGLPAALKGKYVASDRWYLNWGFLGDEKLFPGSAKYQVLCDQNQDYAIEYGHKYDLSLLDFTQVDMGQYSKSVAIYEKRS